MRGGFSEWSAAGYATVGAPEAEVDLDTAFNTFLGNMEGYNTIGLDAVNLALADDPPPFLLDVRELAEVEETGHIEGAVNLPYPRDAGQPGRGRRLTPSSSATAVVAGAAPSPSPPWARWAIRNR